MQTPNTLAIWLSEQLLPLAIIACLIACFMVVLSISARNRRRRMNEERSGTNEETFVNALMMYGFDPEVSSTVYRYLQDHQNVHFPIETSDLLDEDLGLDQADVEQTIRAVFQMARRQLQPGLLHTPLLTVEDLVRLVQASPRLTMAA